MDFRIFFRCKSTRFDFIPVVRRRVFSNLDTISLVTWVRQHQFYDSLSLSPSPCSSCRMIQPHSVIVICRHCGHIKVNTPAAIISCGMRFFSALLCHFRHTNVTIWRSAVHSSSFVCIGCVGGINWTASTTPLAPYEWDNFWIANILDDECRTDATFVLGPIHVTDVDTRESREYMNTQFENECIIFWLLS